MVSLDKNFRDRALQFIKRIPKGKVVSYGQVAASCGHAGAARAVGGILRSLPDDTDIPWWRVINNQGLISMKGNWIATKDMQRVLLMKEGVAVSKEFKIDIARYRYASMAK